MHKNKRIFANVNPAVLPACSTYTTSGLHYIKIEGEIGVPGKTDAETIEKIVEALLKKGVKSIQVKLNTGGGSVFAANDIVAQLERFESVIVNAGSLVASAGTYILAKFCKKATARKNTQFMIHKPSSMVSGNETSIEADLQLLKNITKDYRSTYAECFGKTEDEIEEMWAKGDKWLTASEAKALGLIASIEPTEEPIDERTAKWLKACGAPKYVANIKPKPKPTPKSMTTEELIEFLGLEAGATDEEIRTALEDMKKKAEEADPEDQTAALDKEARAFIKQAILDKKIKADMLEHYVSMYKASPKATKKVVEAMEELPQLSAEVEKKAKEDQLKARKDWTLEDYLEKDPKAYKAMLKDDPEMAAKLEKEYFKN